MTIDDNEWTALARYAAGECSPEERETMRRWIAESEERTRLAFELELIGRASVLDRAEWNTNSAWERLSVRAGAPQPSPESSRSTAPSPPPSRSGRPLTMLHSPISNRVKLRVWGIAAALLVAVAGAYVFRGRLASTPTIAAVDTTSERDFGTQRAQVAEVRLRDGTTVSLAPESRLTVMPGYGTAERAVRLVGEGFFRVMHDSLRPFTVHTAKGDVRDLGTAFAVTSYPGDSTLRVIVSEGRVRVLIAGQTSPSGPVLEQGDVAHVGSASTPRVEHGVDVGQYLGWTQGHLSFYRAPLSDVVVQLGRWYDLRFVLQDSTLRTRRVTMAVSTTSADALVDAMSAALDLRAVRRGDTITLRADPHASGTSDQP
ncbi:MAG TPA: FecR domain-containing protein [Gemmatimonadaceae bacterium]|nr:FecR domain-containing protein [Gemmatimonadaceae bacterium]